MFRKILAGSSIILWLMLLGIDFSGDAGLIQQYLGSETDRAVDSVLTDYGQATDISNDTTLTVRPILASHLGGFYSPSLIHGVSTERINKEAPFSRESIPLYKFHLAFLI